MDTFGEISFIVNSTINDSLEGKKEVKPKDGDTFRISRMGLLAAKYMGRHNGYQGGTLLNVSNLWMRKLE